MGAVTGRDQTDPASGLATEGLEDPQRDQGGERRVASAPCNGSRPS
jgi:hypothetical protein